MKNKIGRLTVLAFFLITIFFSCDQGEYKGKYVFELYTDSVTIDADGEEVWVKFRANGKWEIKDVPDWLEVDVLEGEYSGGVRLSAKKNEGAESRKASLSFVYGNGSKTLEVEQISWKDLPPFIKFDGYPVILPQKGGERDVKISSNTFWHIKDVPQWISVSPQSGDGSTNITIRVAESRSFGDRKGILTFIGKDVKEVLVVEQMGLNNINRFPILPGFSIDGFETNLEGNYYKIIQEMLFVNPGLAEKVYLGNLVNSNIVSNADISEFTGYVFNPVTVSATSYYFKDKKSTFVPSLSSQAAFAKKILEEDNRSAFVINDEGYEYFNHKQLATVGMLSLGIRLDELLFGSSFRQQEMTRKYGMILSFKRTSFNLTIDNPEKLIEGSLKDSDRRQGVAYVASVLYGKVELLVIESDIDSQEIRKVVKKVLFDESLTEEETNLLYSADIWRVYFDNNNQVHAEKGNLDVVQAYREAREYKIDNIYPIGFRLADYGKHSAKRLTFTLTF